MNKLRFPVRNLCSKNDPKLVIAINKIVINKTGYKNSVEVRDSRIYQNRIVHKKNGKKDTENIIKILVVNNEFCERIKHLKVSKW